MGKLTFDQFLKLVERSRLVDADPLAHCVAQAMSQPPRQDPVDPAPLAEQLIRGQLLTRWQCEKLLEGRHRGFFLGGYKLLDHLGSGGMSNVYLAEHVLMQRRVAIKVLPRNRVADTSFLARFRFEGQVAGALAHQNIVRAYDLGSEGRIHFLAMEYVDGSNLEDLARRAWPISFHTAANYIAQAATGLEHAHARGLVHRDIKPANLLVDRQGMVKILDMGLAKFEAEVQPTPDFAEQDEVLGTAEYVAPEQAVNSFAVDHRADIYGLGCTLYFLLTGHPPFQANTAVELLTAHREHSPPEVLAARPDAPPALVAICQKMMEKEPADRFQRAREVADALNAWLVSQRAAGSVGPRSEAPPGVAATRATDLPAESSGQFGERAGKSADTGSDVLAPGGDRREDRARSPSGSDVIDTPPPPIPPLASPPRDAQREAIPTVAPLAIPSRAPSQMPRTSTHAPRSVGSSWKAAGRIASKSGTPSFLWTLVLSALVIGAVLLSLFALLQ